LKNLKTLQEELKLIAEIIKKAKNCESLEDLIVDLEDRVSKIKAAFKVMR